MAYQPSTSLMLAIDGHLHVYPGHRLDRLVAACLGALDGAAGRAPGNQPAALLTESAGCDFFRRARRGHAAEIQGDLSADPGPDDDTLWLRHAHYPQPLWVFAGRQIATAERLEVLSLTRDTPLPDGLPVRETLERVRDSGACPCLAWAPGKWWGARGRLVSRTLADETLFAALGDSALRPRGWREPALMRMAARRGRPILAGSDPLPIPGEERRAGQYGCRIRLDGFDPRQPAASLRAALARGGDGIERIGRRCGPLTWLHGQLAYRIIRRRRKADNSSAMWRA